MMRLRRILARLGNLFRNNRAEQELAREVASHLVLMADDFERRGMSREDALLAAKRAYGGVEQVKQAHRNERTLLWLEHTIQDLRHAVRALGRSPVFTLVAIVTIALGVGINTTLFTAYDAVALKPLPVANASSVVRLRRTLESHMIGDPQYAFSYPEYVNLRDHQNVLQDVIAASGPVRVLAAVQVEGSNHAIQFRPAEAEIVSANYFGALGINAMLGRIFGPEENGGPGGNPAVVLSYPFWQRRYHGDMHVLGKALKLGSTSFTVIGVAPPEFTGTDLNPQVPDLWAPVSMQKQLVPGQDWLHKPTDFEFQILARLNPGVAMKQAEAQTDALVRQFAATYTWRDHTLAVEMERTAFFGNTNDPRFRAGVGAVMVIFALVLLVACANVTNMLVARGAARQKEISIRLALGASRARVVRHLLTESMLLAIGGGVVGLALAAVSGKLLSIALEQILVRQLGSDFVLSLKLNPDARVLTYALVMSLATGLIFGLSPALQFTKPDLNTSLKDESTSFGRGVTRSRLRGFLIAGQVAVSMLLLSSSGLLIRGLSFRGDQQGALSAVWAQLRVHAPDLLASVTFWNVENMFVAPQRTLARALATLGTILALLALSLAGIGIYGVMAYVVSQRTQEIGIRIALGAPALRVLQRVAIEGLGPVMSGAVIGLSAGALLSLLLHRTLAFPGSIDFLYGVSFYDPITFSAIFLFLLLVSLAASLGPALKAINVDPLVALRYE